MLYKNTSNVTKTFHGVTFKPGEMHNVPGYIYDVRFVKVKADAEKTDAAPQEEAKPAEKKTEDAKKTKEKPKDKPASDPGIDKPQEDNNNGGN